ncbi:peptide/nickel transport system permease protein [Devosia enhydra]|uniref:Peptide/nickel transport system permease protein n=1 Tax=Devosia enhydra TaxID=665118 RepID=A0A1K2I1P0_9HYPH|nr:ABC transporter permease [Devosia enhydra]SFZ86175.1 peptide/nickel transport system permease protein [Devosia enhydra]
MRSGTRATRQISRLFRHPSIVLGLVVAGLFLCLGLTSLVWTPYPIDRVDIARQLGEPSLRNWLGTDHLGRDLLSLLMAGTLTSFVVATIAVAIGAMIGVPLGLIAAARGGWAEWLVLRLSDFLFAFPALITAILITAIAGPGAINAMLAIGIFNIPVFARVARGGAMALIGLDYIGAARLAGLGPFGIAWRHLLPNIAGLIIVQGTIQLALAIVAEAGLSYVGLGTQAPGTSLGLLLREAQTFVLFKPHLALIPGLALVLIVVALNLAGDGLRDLLDPRLARAERVA